jgi:hypothetical protein
VGSIPAVNFLKVPTDKPLGLPGRFLYLQVKASTPSKLSCSCCLQHTPEQRLNSMVLVVLRVQVKFEPGAPLFAVHTECLTADGNTCRVSVGNIFKAENLKAS